MLAVGIVSLILVILILAIVSLKKRCDRYCPSYATLTEEVAMENFEMTSESEKFKYVKFRE